MVGGCYGRSTRMVRRVVGAASEKKNIVRDGGIQQAALLPEPQAQFQLCFSQA
ncbi:hypothetical protein KSP40_PGU003838 [Platanthera guangdongensis]|uniref:Uncharacterized protein n=1 Tax=Platanthera guangdongensis TaxID=2320717 RepID=A0ABR2MY20_9ASPA